MTDLSVEPCAVSSRYADTPVVQVAVDLVDHFRKVGTKERYANLPKNNYITEGATMYVFDITAKPRYGNDKLIRIVARNAVHAIERSLVNFRKQHTSIDAVIHVERTVEVYL